MGATALYIATTDPNMHKVTPGNIPRVLPGKTDPSDLVCRLEGEWKGSRTCLNLADMPNYGIHVITSI